MSFAENLQELRKRKNMTQEQLAESLEVSRQSVSKWESGGNYPEMEKILQICEMFHCDMGVLMQGDVSKGYVEDKANYDAHKNRFSKMIAVGVGIILLGITIGMLLPLLGLEDALMSIVIFASVIVATMIFIVAGMQNESFVKKHPAVEDFYTEGEKEAFDKKFIIYIVTGVGMILLGVLWIIGSEIILVSMGIDEDFGVVPFLLILSIAVPVIIYAGMQKAKYNVAEYNRENNPDEETKKRNSLIGKLCGCIMLIATAIYLGLGFVLGGWQYAPVIYAIGGILCGVVSVALSRESK